jgi:hypothetical protein
MSCLSTIRPAAIGLSLIAMLLSACGGGSDDDTTAMSGEARSALQTTRAAAAAPSLAAQPGVHSIKLSWAGGGASRYNAYLSSSASCDIALYAQCPEGRMLPNVQSPLEVGGLVNGRVYHARLEVLGAGGTVVSNQASARPNTIAFNGAVRAMGFTPDGSAYLGGSFTAAGVTSGQGVALSTASAQPTQAAFPMVVGGAVLAAAPDGAGGWYIGGGFKRVGSLARRHLAHVFADGSVDANWKPEPNATVRAIAVMAGVVYVGGDFSRVLGQKRVGLAAVNTAGTLSAWNPEANRGVTALAAGNGTIYAGGFFDAVGAFGRGHLVAFDAQANVLPWNPGADNLVRTLVLAGSTLYAGGDFTSVAGQARNCLAAIGTDGVLRAWNPNVQSCPAAHVRGIAVDGNTVYVGGSFAAAGPGAGAPRNGLAAFDLHGALLPWNPGADAAVHTLAVTKSASGATTIFVGGDFSAVGARRRLHLAAIDSGGSVRAWKSEPNAPVHVLSDAGTSLYAGGDFTGLGAVRRRYLAALDGDGALLPWNPNANSHVHAMGMAGTTVFAGGSFTAIGGQARPRLAAIDVTGRLESWNPGTDGTVNALAVSGITVYAGGDFGSAAGQPRARLAAFGTAGELRAWNPGADGAVNALALTSSVVFGDTVYMGGAFSNVAGQTRRRLAAVSDLGVLKPWNPQCCDNVGAGEVVHALRSSGSTIYAGGSFGKIGVFGRRGLAAVSTAGQVLPWAPSADNVVHTLAVLGQTVYAGGEFTQISAFDGSSAARRGLAAIDIDGRPTAWNPNANGTVARIEPFNGTLHVGGSFTQMGSTVAGGWKTLAP